MANQHPSKVRTKTRSTRTVTFGVASSLDNYIARKDGGVDWLCWGKEVADITSRFWKTIDVVVMGRKTYELGPKDGYPGVENYVFSRTLSEGARGGVKIVSKDPASFVKMLKRRPGKGICVMGGGELAKTLFEANLIDELGLNIHPVILGSGIPLFYEMTKQVDLELLECQRFQNACVFVRYRVKK